MAVFISSREAVGSHCPRQITKYSAGRDCSFMTGFFRANATESVRDASVAARLKLRLSPRDILLQNPFNFGNGFWMVHQVVTGWNSLL